MHRTPPLKRLLLFLSVFFCMVAFFVLLDSPLFFFLFFCPMLAPFGAWLWVGKTRKIVLTAQLITFGIALVFFGVTFYACWFPPAPLGCSQDLGSLAGYPVIFWIVSIGSTFIASFIPHGYSDKDIPIYPSFKEKTWRMLILGSLGIGVFLLVLAWGVSFFNRTQVYQDEKYNFSLRYPNREKKFLFIEAEWKVVTGQLKKWYEIDIRKYVDDLNDENYVNVEIYIHPLNSQLSDIFPELFLLVETPQIRQDIAITQEQKGGSLLEQLVGATEILFQDEKNFQKQNIVVDGYPATRISFTSQYDDNNWLAYTILTRENDVYVISQFSSSINWEVAERIVNSIDFER